MMFTRSNSQMNVDTLGDGEYYVFCKQEGTQIWLGYTYTTWCGSPGGMYMLFSSVELGKPLPLVQSRASQSDYGQLKIFSFDSRNPRLINDVYKRAMSWLKTMQQNLKYPHLDESPGCTTNVIVIKKGVLSAVYSKEVYLELCNPLENIFGKPFR